VHGDSPSESEWYLCYLGFYLAVFLYRPAHIVSDDLGSVEELDNWESLIPTDDMPDRAIGVPCIEVVFHEHDSCPDFEYQSLRCETSLLERFDELVSSLGLHIEDEYITRDRVQFLFVVGIDRDVAGKEFCMILSLDGNIA